MFVNNNKITEELKITSAIAPAASAGASSSALIPAGSASKLASLVSVGSLTTASSVVVSVWESTASTWNGAVATEVATYRSTTSVTTSSSAVITVDIDPDTLGKQFVGIRVTKTDTAAPIGAQFLQAGNRYGNHS